MEEKMVSIVTPCYNGEMYAVRFFENILQQTYQNIELIFINDGSVDKTEEIALEYKKKFENQNRKFIYLYQKNAGQAAAVNQGIKIFNGDYLIWTDADDIFDKNNVKHKVEFLEKHPEYEFAQCFGKEALESDMNKKVRDFRRIPPIGKDNFFEDIIMKRNVEYTPGIYIVKREAFLEANPERDIVESRIGQNYQMLLPIAYKYRCGYIEEDLFTYVIRENSHSHDRITTEEFVARSLETKKLLLDTLKRINLDNWDYYECKVDEKITRDQFNAGYALKNAELLKKAYKELKEKKYITKRDYFVYFAYSNIIIDVLFKFLKKIKANIKLIYSKL